MLAMSARVLELKEISLLLSSFLSQNDCWSLRYTTRRVFSADAAPLVRRALAWRQELRQLFALLEIVLTSKASQPVSLQEIRSSFAESSAAVLSDVRLGQLLTFTGKMIAIQPTNGSEWALAQQSDDGVLRAHTFLELHDRSVCLESVLASATEQLATNRVPTHESMLSLRPPSKRRLSRQSSITLPKGARLQETAEHMQAWNSAKSRLAECEKGLSIVQGAEKARAVLEQLCAKGCAPSKCAVQDAMKVKPLDKLAPSLVLLLAGSSGGLAIDRVTSGYRFQPYARFTSSRAKEVLQKQLVALEQRHRQVRLESKQAFVNMMKGGGEGGSEGDDEP